MLLSEQEIELTIDASGDACFASLAHGIAAVFDRHATPIRFVVPRSEGCKWHCEVGLLAHGGQEQIASRVAAIESIFRFHRRNIETTERFNAVVLVPTGIGAEIGGHAGDAGPVARLLAQACDRLITHPNVVNASDINEIPDNALYVEGSVITRLLMGTIGLQPARSNRVMVIIDAHQDQLFVNIAVNSVSAARATYGLACPAVLRHDPPVKLRARYTSSGRAAGRVERLDELCTVIDEHVGQFDALSISSVIDVPHSFHADYFLSKGAMVNPWGGVEAMLTHTLSSIYNVPTAHSPMFESQAIANMDVGIVDPRMAAEAVSTGFLQCTLKGLMRSPRIVTNGESVRSASTITVDDVSCVIIPDRCLGLPTLAALHQGIPVIAVRENRNVMQNDLAALPWRPGQLFQVENYWEAVGVMAALRAGIAAESVRRPFADTTVLGAQRDATFDKNQSADHPVNSSRM